MVLDDSEVIVRSALVPRILDNGLVAPQAVVTPFLGKTLESGEKSFALSVGSKTMLPTQELVHDFGCRVAQAANEYMQNKADHVLVRGEETVHYRGSYDLDVGQVHAIESDVFAARVVHAPENNLEEHCDIELHPKAPNMSRRVKGNAVTGVIARLFPLLRSPSEHICGCDDDLRGKLEQHRLRDFSLG